MLIIKSDKLVKRESAINKVRYYMAIIKDSNNPFLQKVYKTLKKKYEED